MVRWWWSDVASHAFLSSSSSPQRRQKLAVTTPLSVILAQEPLSLSCCPLPCCWTIKFTDQRLINRTNLNLGSINYWRSQILWWEAQSGGVFWWWWSEECWMFQHYVFL
jgi:hypothetical protein